MRKGDSGKIYSEIFITGCHEISTGAERTHDVVQPDYPGSPKKSWDGRHENGAGLAANENVIISAWTLMQ